MATRSSRSTARRHGAVRPGPAPQSGPASDVHPVLRRAGAPPEAVGLLTQARQGLDEARGLELPNDRYATAHLAALRTAAAVLAVRARPGPDPYRTSGSSGSPPRRARREPIRSAWELLPEVAPELGEWSMLFAAGAHRRARAEAGIRGAVSRRDADDLLRDAGMFLRIVERLLMLQPVLPQPRMDPTDRPGDRTEETGGADGRGAGLRTDGGEVRREAG